MNFQDDNWDGSVEALKNWSCYEANEHGYSFIYYAIDPESNPFTDKYRALTLPANLVLDDDMVIRYKLGIYSLSGLRNIVDTLMDE